MKVGDVVEVIYNEQNGIVVTKTTIPAIVIEIMGSKFKVKSMRWKFPDGADEIWLPYDQRGHLWR